MNYSELLQLAKGWGNFISDRIIIWRLRYFHQEMGKTPFAFLNEYRIKKAAILLDDSSLSVSDIAINCGFDNISYFIRKFKEYQGITPKKYRSRKMPE